MQLLKRVFSFYVFSNIHVAVAVSSLVYITAVKYGVDTEPFASFSFFSTILAYNAIRYFQLEKIDTTLAIWMRSNWKWLLVLNAGALAGSAFYLLDFSRSAAITLIPLILPTALYVFPFKQRVMGLRNVPGLKLFLISFTWAGLTSFLPLYAGGDFGMREEILGFVQRFLFIMAITIPFDIRDAYHDKPGLGTLPQTIGINFSKQLAVCALLIVGATALFFNVQESVFLRIDLGILVLSILMVSFSGPYRSWFYTAFWMEALPILWCLLYLFFIN